MFRPIPPTRPRVSGFLFLLLAFAAFGLWSCSQYASGAPKMTPKSMALHDGMRKLWEDHIAYTRLFIVDAAGGLPEQNATTDRLLQNQDDIGIAIKPYYGEEAGTKLTALLREHISTAGELVMAAKANDAAKVDDAKKRWYANADAIASFLSGANPKNWPGPDMKKMMEDHLNLTLDEATAQLKSDWKGSIVDFDKVQMQILTMADMLSDGIVSQFPDKF